MSTTNLSPGEGLTLNTQLPENIVLSYQPSFYEKLQNAISYVWPVFPIIVFVVFYRIWKKYSDDPDVKGAVVPEFEIPQKFSPLMLDGILHYGKTSTEGITATIIYYATKGYITITQTPKKLFKKSGFSFSLIKPIDTLPESPDKKLLHTLFGTKTTIGNKNMVHFFNYDLPTIQAELLKEVTNQGFIEKNNGWIPILGWSTSFIGLFLLLAIIQNELNLWMFVAGALSIAIIILFIVLLPKRSVKGAQMLYRIKGLKMYMKTAERYRQPFFEKENIYEYFLPYAILFGVATMWSKKMKTLLGDSANSYVPLWYTGSAGNAFNADSFTSDMTNVVNSINSSVSSASSSSSGSSGGGGGGGGGGGW